MMRIGDCIVFGNQNSLRDFSARIEEYNELRDWWAEQFVNDRTAKAIEIDASITDTNGYKYKRTEYVCDACMKKVIGGDNYCSHCGARLEWRKNAEV